MGHKHRAAPVRDLLISAVVFGALAALVLVSQREAVQGGTSQVNATIPAPGAASASTPVRGNFGIIRNEINALQDKVSDLVIDHNLPRYDATGSGKLTDGLCTQADAGALLCTASSGNALTITNVGTGLTAWFTNGGTGSFAINAKGFTSIADDSTNTALTVTQQSSTGKALSVATGAGSAGDMTLSLDETSGHCLATIATNDDPKICTTQARGATTNGTATALQSFTIGADTIYSIEARIVAHCTSGSACTAVDEDGAAYIFRGVYYISSGAISIINEDLTVVGESRAAWTVGTTNSSSTLYLNVTGEANANITWHTTTTVQSVGS